VNILYVESSRSWGGQEYRTCLEVNWLNAHGHQAWLICNPDSQVHSKATELGTRLVTMPLRSRVDPLGSLRLWKFCRKNKIDLLKTYSSKDHWICLPLFLYGIPLSRARCITDPIGSRSRAFVFKHGCSQIVADASVIKRELVEQHGIDSGKIEVIGSAVDLEKFKPPRDRTKFRREIGVGDDVPLIGNVGMIRPDKGQLELVKSAPLILEKRPDARFVIVGQGTGILKRGINVRNAIDRAGLADKIIMAGYRWDTPDVFAACDMIVIASLRTEASPIVLREAFASGRPVIATNVGDIPEILRHRENGLLIQPGNTHALASAILDFVSDPELAAHCGANGLRYAIENFSFDKMMEAKLRADLKIIRDKDAIKGDLPRARRRRNSALHPKSLASSGTIDRVDQLAETPKSGANRRES
jgi:glycosyltransferase involved in cell wall biosynthesis